MTAKQKSRPGPKPKPQEQKARRFNASLTPYTHGLLYTLDPRQRSALIDRAVKLYFGIGLQDTRLPTDWNVVIERVADEKLRDVEPDYRPLPIRDVAPDTAEAECEEE